MSKPKTRTPAQPAPAASSDPPSVTDATSAAVAEGLVSLDAAPARRAAEAFETVADTARKALDTTVFAERRDTDAEDLSALCAAQSQHPSDLAERAIRLLVERIARRVLAS